MKIFISADIEGVNGMTDWDEANKAKADYTVFAKRQAIEIKSVVNGLTKKDKDMEVYIKDGHDTARNITHEELPRNTVLIRNSGRDPLIMMSGLNQYDFVGSIFTGYHSGIGTKGCPLAHTMEYNGINYMKINGILANEFLINYYTSLYYKVPVIMVTGDKDLCEMVKGIDPNIHTVATHIGYGAAVISKHPELTYEELEKEAGIALENRDKCSLAMPEKFSVEISFKEHMQAQRASYYPGVIRIADNAILFETDDYFEYLKMYMFTA